MLLVHLGLVSSEQDTPAPGLGPDRQTGGFFERHSDHSGRASRSARAVRRRKTNMSARSFHVRPPKSGWQAASGYNRRWRPIGAPHYGGHIERSARHRRVIDGNAAIGQHPLKVSIADWELKVPTHRPKNHVGRKMTASELIFALIHRSGPAPRSLS